MRLLKPHWVTHGSITKREVHLRPIYTLDLHPDGKRLATGGFSEEAGLIILWDMELIRDPKKESDSSSKILYQMDNIQSCVNCVRWSPTGRWLASGGMDRVVSLWVKTAVGARSSGLFGTSEKVKFSERWRCAAVLRNHTGDIIDLAWAHDGTRLASTSVDNTIVIWGASGSSPSNDHNSSAVDRRSHPFQVLTALRGQQGPVKGVAWDPAGRYLATQAENGGVRIWRTADWQIESKISEPFKNAADQALVTRLSWSPDGSVIAAPHAVNNDFPTAQLITRNKWQTGLDLVGHEKHVCCARYNPNILQKRGDNSGSGNVCLALGGKDRTLSVWTTSSNRALVVLRDLFTSAITDLTWSASGYELMASSLEGNVAYLKFTKEELGEPLRLEEVANLHRRLFGQSLIDGLLRLNTSSLLPSSNGGGGSGAVVLETPEALALQRSQAELRQKLGGSAASPATPDNPTAPKLPKASAQVESRTKDGRRRITPSFLGTLDCLDEEPPSILPTLTEEPSRTFDSPPTLKSALLTAMPPPVSRPQAINPPPGPSNTNGSTTPRRNNGSNQNVPPDTVIVLDEGSSETSNSSAAPKGSPGDADKKRKRVELTTISADTKDIEKTSKIARKRARRLRTGEDLEAANTKSTQRSGGNIASAPPIHRSTPIKSTEKSGTSVVTDAKSGIPRVTLFNAPDQIELTGEKAQFVCAHPVEGPLIIDIINDTSKEKGREAIHRVTANCSSDGNTRTLWNITSSHRFTSHAHADNWLAVGDANSRLRLLWSGGSNVCPPLLLDSPAQLLATTKTSLLAVFTQSGHLIVWALDQSLNQTCRSRFGMGIKQNLPSIIVESHVDTSSCRATSLDFSSEGTGHHPVLRFKSGSSLLFHMERKVWVELFDAGPYGGDEFRRRLAAVTHRNCPSGPLAAMQQFGRLEIPVNSEISPRTPAQRRDVLEFFDAQVQVAELFGSAAEFKFWLVKDFQQLVENGDETRVRQICMDLIGPYSPSGHSSWEPTIKGLSKRAIVKDLLTYFALNLRMQRLYVELKELYEQTQELA